MQADAGVFGAISCLKKLKCLRIEASEEFRLDVPHMADRLSTLTMVHPSPNIIAHIMHIMFAAAPQWGIHRGGGGLTRHQFVVHYTRQH